MNVHNSIHVIVFPGSFFLHPFLQRNSAITLFLWAKSSRDVIEIGLLVWGKKGLDAPKSLIQTQSEQSWTSRFHFCPSPFFFRRMNHTPTHPNSVLITRFYLWALIFHFLWALSYLVISYKKRGMRFDSYCNQNFLTTATTRFWLIFYKRLTILRYSQNSDWFRKFRPEWHH